MKRLTFNGINDLYQHPLYGARTLENIAEMDALRAKLPVKKTYPPLPSCSMELEERNERCIDENGCGMF